MSGHSKWSTIKRKKAKVDAERGKAFTRIIKDITIAAREGGGDESSNPALRSAITAAKGANMPAANIERAIKKGTGELPGVVYEEGVLEGYGPGGVAIFIDILTDNRKRTVADVRHYLSKHGGNLAESGAVAWMFEKKGQLAVPVDGVDEESLLMIAMESGAEDMKVEEGFFEITSSTSELEAIRKAVEAEGLKVENYGLTMLPKNTVSVAGKNALQLLKLMDLLEEHDDVQQVYSNFDIDESVMEGLDS